MTRQQHLWTVLLLLGLTDTLPSSSNSSSSWLDSVLGQSRQGVFTADFEGENNTLLEVGDGDNIILDCRVFLKQEKTISWLRHTSETSASPGVPDLLTVGNTTYSGDTRIKSSFSYPNNWRLEIADVQKKDSGLYICQISTHPPMGLHTIIRVKDAILEMLGEDLDPSSPQSLPPDKFYNPGSDISLKCIIRRHLIKNATVQDITNVSWKKDGVIIDLQTQERISMGVEVSGNLVTSTLLVSHAVLGDAGPYSCTLPVFSNKDFPRAQAIVHVIYGDHLAVQRNGVTLYICTRSALMYLTLLCSYSLQ